MHWLAQGLRDKVKLRLNLDNTGLEEKREKKLYTTYSLFPPATWGPGASLLRLLTFSIPDCLTCLLRNLYSGQEATVRTRHGKMSQFKTEKGVQQANCYPAYLTYMKSTSWEILGCMNHKKLESRLIGEISTTLDKQMIPT